MALASATTTDQQIQSDVLNELWDARLQPDWNYRSREPCNN